MMNTAYRMFSNFFKLLNELQDFVTYHSSLTAVQVILKNCYQLIIIINAEIRVTLNKKCCRGTLQKLSQHAVSQQRRRWTKLSSDPAETTAVTWALVDDGRAFHARAAATGKARSPSVERRVEGAISVDVAADRRRRRTSTSAVFCSDSARYCGAVPLRQRW